MSATGVSINTVKDVRPALASDPHQRWVYETFKGHFAKRASAADDGEPTGTAGDVNILIGDRNCFEYHVIGTQTILGPVRTSAGLNISQDLTNNDGVEYTLGNEMPANTVISNVAGATRGTFVVGTDAAFGLSVKMTITDVSGADALFIGFRKAEAYQAAEDDYDEMCAIGSVSGDIKVATILNNAATSTTDTTNDWADAATKTLTVYCDSLGGLWGTPRACYFEIDGAKPTTVPTSVFRFDSGEIVIPFLYLRHDSDVAESTILKEWNSGLLTGGGHFNQLAYQL